MHLLMPTIVVLSMVLTAFAGDPPECADTLHVNGQPMYLIACDQILAKYRSDASHSAVAGLESQLGLDSIRAPLPQWVLYHINGESSVMDVMASLRSSPWILAAHPDFFVEPCMEYIPSDPLWPDQSPYLATDPSSPFPSDHNLGSNVDKAWAFTRGGDNVAINLMDTGSPERAPFAGCDPGEIHPDFFFGSEWDPRFTRFFRHPDVVDYWADENGHATAMAGLLAARHDNEGMTGINHDSPLLISKIYRISPGNDSHLSRFLDAVVAAMQLAPQLNQVVVFPYEAVQFGTIQECSQFDFGYFEAVEDAISLAWDAGAGHLLFVFPAGNEDQETRNMKVPAIFGGCGSYLPEYENGYPNVISVRAYMEQTPDVRSAYGPHLSILAPGGQSRCLSPDDPYGAGDVRCTTLWHELADCMWVPSCQSVDWSWCAGSSAACANAAGMISLVWSTAPDLGPGEIRDVVEQTSYNPLLGDPPCRGYHEGAGWGAINTFEAIVAAPSSEDLRLISDLVIDNRVDPTTCDPLVINRHLVVPDGQTLTIRTEAIPQILYFSSSGKITVESGGELVLTSSSLDPSAELTLEFAPGSRIVVENGGRISAHAPYGEHPIRFVAADVAPENAWGGIYLGSTGNLFTHCRFENASVAIRAISEGGVTLSGCDFDSCGIGVAALYGSSVQLTDCNITNSRYYGVLAAARSSLTMSGTQALRNRIEGSARAGIWSASIATTDLDNVWIEDNGPEDIGDRLLIHGGIRNTYSTVQMNCVTSTANNGPGLSAWGGFTDMAWQLGDNGRNVISENYEWGSGRTQIVFCNARVDLCEGRNKISADNSNSTLIEECSANPVEVDVFHNNWGAQIVPAGRIPDNYLYSPIDGNATSNRCSLPEILPGCILGPAAQWYDQGWQQENSLQFAAAIESYQYVIDNYPGSKEAKLCPDRILFCEGKLTKDWSNWREYFLDLAETTSDLDLVFMAKTSAAWCLVELDDFEQAEAELQNLMDQADSEYKYQKAALSQLLAELKEAPWDTIGISNHDGGHRSGGAIDQAVEADRLLNVVNRMEAVLGGAGFSGSHVMLPVRYSLHQNYPNPFNPTTTIRFDLPEAARVELRVFNTLGQQVATLIDEARPAGIYQVHWDGSQAASGVYLYQLKSGNFTETKKMVLMK